MKLNIDIKNKKGSLDANIEKLIEKNMDLHEKDWKDKFNTKQKAKKEIIELKHKQKIELNEQNKNKKNWLQKLMEEKRKNKEIELEDKRKREEAEKIERQKVLKIKIIFTILLGILAITFFSLGTFLGNASLDPNSGWYAFQVISIFIGISIIFIWIPENENKKKRKK